MPRLPAPPASATITNVDIGDAVRNARSNRLTQAQLGEALGISQPQVSAIEAGSRPLTVTELVNIERACGREPGWVLAACGYMDAVPDVLAALDRDAALSDDSLVILKGSYQLARERGRARS